MQEVLAEKELYRNLASTIAVLLYVFFAVSRIIYPKLFAAIYSFEKFLIFKYKDDFGSGIRLFSTESFYFTGVLSLVVSFALLSLYLFDPQISALIPWLKIESFQFGILVWLILGVVIQFLFFLKYLFLKLVGWVFDISTDETRHFQEYQSFNHSFSLILYFVLSCSLFMRFNFPIVSISILAILVVIYLFFRLINLYFKIRSLGACSNLYIFSYLCSTELMPTLIGINLII